MTTIELSKKIGELKGLEALIKEAEAEAEKLKDEIKSEMNKQHLEEMVCGKYIVRYKEISSDKFDSKTFKNEHPKYYKMYLKQSVCKRFTITG